jgi:hypothetical protein
MLIFGTLAFGTIITYRLKKLATTNSRAEYLLRPSAEQRQQFRCMGIQGFLKDPFFDFPTYEFLHKQDVLAAKSIKQFQYF